MCLLFSYQPKESTSIGLYVMAEAISPEHSYFEMEILDTGRVNSIGKNWNYYQENLPLLK